MMGWEDKIRNMFPRAGEVYLVKDRDNILDDSSVIDMFSRNNIDYIDFLDPIVFRYAYETKYKYERTNTLIIRTDNYSEIPYDVYSNSFQVQIKLKDVITFLDYSAMKEYSIGIPELVHIDSFQNKTLNYEETKRLLSKDQSREDSEEYVLPVANDITTFGLVVMIIGQWRSGDNTLNDKQISSINDVNSKFQNWLIQNFDQTVSLPSYPKPKMVHQIPDFMNHSDYNQKKALIVMDGMSFTQWNIINDYLINNQFKTEVSPTLAWIPSITSVSRQSIFSGKPPLNFSDTINTTNYEEKQWEDFWVDKGFDKSDIFYQRALGSDNYLEMDLQHILRNKKIVGCVIDSIDRFMHAAQQGLWSVHSELNYWLNKGFLLSFLKDLIENDFEVYITSDHGNIESQGVGRINQGVLANSKGERVRVYDDKNIRNRTREDYFEVSENWDSQFLPQNYYPLIAKENYAFITKNDKIVGHGGTSIEEVFVPFVKVTR
ncbi:BREX-3 system phosphatase PglZ [Enterococcus faecium]|nr:BREX-3 system phosphatase PglZ [Enterococcus faecium]MCZ1362661.1 BREX-3 system phosphatase PglZ [Enterococcus faecium]PLQ03202.1 BREX-3 system phosphatase PglZ [Enterococcus faecium]ROY70809.1 BREX-3 system phosphatase PglZ [Enterococcus faecium]ROZ04647.1 BREX-3 system phosphatase PglZ [Enterococcus faecium]